MAIISARLRKIKDDPAFIVDPAVVKGACVKAGHRWRRRRLGPCQTLRAFVAQVVWGNTAITDLARLLGADWSPSAYCQARERLPLEVVKAVLEDFTQRARPRPPERGGCWRGRRVALMDGTGVVMPDTPVLRQHFGTSPNCPPGCGLPQAHLLTLFDAHTGLLLDMRISPARTHDLRSARDLHPALRRGDVVVADRGLCAYTHLAMLASAGLFGLFRVSRSRGLPFPASRGPRRRHAYNRHRSEEPVLVHQFGPDDQLIEIVKPHNRPAHIGPEDFARIPSTMLVRAVRYRVDDPGRRQREIVLLTTLLDASKYPAAALAELYFSRWRVEQDIRHLKRTLGMERLKCRSLKGVQRELAVFALVYNAVCLTRELAARAQRVEPARISFVDTVRWLRRTSGGKPVRIAAPAWLLVLPRRPPRIHPRQRKRADSTFMIMHRPRAQIIRWITNHPRTAN